MSADIIVSLNADTQTVKIEQVTVTDALIEFIKTYPKNQGIEKPLNDFTDAVYQLLDSILDGYSLRVISDLVDSNTETFIEHLAYSEPFAPDLVDKLNALNLTFMNSTFLFK